jgi:hypothetical protein
MSSTREKGTENRHGIGQHADPNRSPTGLNTGQRESVKNPEVDYAARRRGSERPRRERRQGRRQVKWNQILVETRVT